VISRPNRVDHGARRTAGALLFVAGIGATAPLIIRAVVPRKILVSLLLGALVTCARKRDAAPRVLLIGVDGAEMEIVDRLIAAGKLPTFARLKKEGASGRLRSAEPLLSPIVWTSIATGRAPQDHGVFDFVEVTPSGEAAPITSARRKVAALWNIAGDFGKSSGFIGWYASYPAEKVKGFVVSDRVAFHQVKSAGAAKGATFPEELAQDLTKEFGAPAPDLASTKARFLADPSAPLTPDGQKRVAELSKIHATADYYRRIAPALQKRFGTDVLGVYFELVDAAGHLFMEDAPPRRKNVSDADFAAFSGTIDRIYEYQDEVLADLMKLEGDGTLTIICSDHGFKTGEKRPWTSGRADVGQAPLWHLLHGVVFLHGRGVASGAVVKDASVLDLAPTALAWLGVPLSKELSGRPVAAAFAPGALGVPKTVAAYAAPPKRTPPAEAAAGDAEAVAKLAALGYLGGAGTRIAHDADGRTANSWLNEGLALMGASEESKALNAFGRALDLEPKNVIAVVNAARIYTSRGELDRAKQLLDRAVALKPNETSVRIQLATWYLQSGRSDEAAAELATAERLDDRLPILHLLKASLAKGRERPDEALAEIARVEELSDDDRLLGNAYAMNADIVMARRDPAAASALYAKALAVKARDSTLARKLGKALSASNDLAGAEKAFQRSVADADTETDREGAYGDLSIFYQYAGREADCIATLERGTKALPKSAPLLAALGAACGRAGRLPDALAAYERSVALAPTPLALKTLAALVFELKHDRARAVSLWRRSLELEPGQRDVEAFLKRYSTPAS
jgi:tetratricopeptide (TPR) repeat protein